MSIVQNDDYQGCVEFELPEIKTLSKTQIVEIIEKLSKIAIMGMIAEAIYTGTLNVNNSTHDTEYINQLYQKLGLSIEQSALKLSILTVTEYNKFKNDQSYMQLLHKVAKKLHRCKTMTFMEMKKLIDKYSNQTSD